MKTFLGFEINSKPAAAVIIAALVVFLGCVGILGWRAPEQLGVLAGLVVTTIVGALHPQALARAGGAPTTTQADGGGDAPAKGQAPPS